MNRHMFLLVVFALGVSYTLAGPAANAQAQAFSGKWVYQGPKGASVLEFYPAEKRLIGPTKGVFHHSIVLDDGRVLQGDGTYVFRHVLPNRGWLTLTFSDGHVTREHEHTINGTRLEVRHHGVFRVYIRQ